MGSVEGLLVAILAYSYLVWVPRLVRRDAHIEGISNTNPSVAFILERILTLTFGGEAAGEDGSPETSFVLTLLALSLSIACNGACTILIGYRSW